VPVMRARSGCLSPGLGVPLLDESLVRVVVLAFLLILLLLLLVVSFLL
jgi:hypothetical protein